MRLSKAKEQRNRRDGESDVMVGWEARTTYQNLRRELRRIECRQLSAGRNLRRVQEGDDTKGIRKSAHELAAAIEESQHLNRLYVPPRREECTFVFSGWMLLDSYRFCTQTPDEELHFIAGIEVAGCLVGTRIITFPYDGQSVAGVQANHGATHDAVVETHEAGHVLMALIHSHPGMSNTHSPTDAKTHRSWEEGFNVIGGIWNREGEIRFFSQGLSFRVIVVGDHMEQVEDEVFRIQKEPLEMPSPEERETRLLEAGDDSGLESGATN